MSNPENFQKSIMEKAIKKLRKLADRRETPKHHEAFWIWYENDRHFDKTGMKLAVTNATLANWIKKFKWHDRADALDQKAQRKVEQMAVTQKAKRQAQMIEQHFKLGGNLLAVGSNYLKDKGLETGSQAIQAVKTGIEIQRKAEGLPDWLTDISEMNQDELLRERDRLLSELANAGDEITGD